MFYGNEHESSMKWVRNIQIYYFEDVFMARFRSARSSEEERELFKKFTPPSTRYATNWAIKIVNEWRGGREVKEVETNDVGFGIDDSSSIQSLCIPL